MSMIVVSPVDLIILGVIVAAQLVLGFVILFTDSRSATNRLFFLLTASIVVWGITNFFSYSITDKAVSLLLARLVLFTAVPFATFVFLLVHTFPSQTLLLSKRNLYFLLLLSAGAMAVAISPFAFKSITVAPDGGIGSPVTGPGIVFFGVIVIFYDLGALVLLIKKTLASQGREWNQRFFLCIGLLLMLISIIIFNFIFPALFKNTTFIPFAAAFTFPFVGFTAYAIARYRLFNIKVIATEALVFVLAITTLTDLLWSRDLLAISLRIVVFGLVLVFGILLMRNAFRDIRQREKVEKLFGDLEKNLGQLKQLDETKTEFLSIASHQLRAPMTAMKGFLSMLKEGDFGSVTTEQQGVLEKVMQAENRLIKLVEDYLNFSRIEAGRAQN